MGAISKTGKPGLQKFTGPGTIPAAKPLTGTITSSGKRIRGVVSTEAVFSLDQEKRLFVIDADITANLIVTKQFNIIGSTGNNGVFYVENFRLIAVGKTEIEVDRPIKSAVADGDIEFVTTNFTTDIFRGEHLYDGIELKIVSFVLDDGLLEVESAFTTPFIGIAFEKCENGLFRSVSIRNRGGSDGTVLGEEFINGAIDSWENEGRGGLKPIFFDATGTVYDINTKT